MIDWLQCAYVARDVDCFLYLFYFQAVNNGVTLLIVLCDVVCVTLRFFACYIA